jgi:hypothetical protein
LGEKLPSPETIDFYPADPQQAKYKGQILLKHLRILEPGEVLVSIPIQNVGPGVAEITGAWITTVEMDRQVPFRSEELRTHVAPGHAVRLSSFLDLYQDPEVVNVTVRYVDFASQNHWQTVISAIPFPSVGAADYTPQQSNTKRLSARDAASPPRG